MEQMFPFNEHNKTIFYVPTFVIYHDHFLFFGLYHHGIFST